MGYRDTYEFSSETKLAALRKTDFCCAECGRHKSETKEGYLQIDHIVPIWFVIKHAHWLPASLVSSVFNAEPLCVSCHEHKHRIEDYRDYVTLAQSLLGMASRV